MQFRLDALSAVHRAKLLIYPFKNKNTNCVEQFVTMSSLLLLAAIKNHHV